MARLVPALLLCAASLAAATPTTDLDTPPSSQLAAAGIEINRFLAQCVDLAWLGIGLQCRGLSCAGEEGAGLSLEQLQRAACGRAEDCAPEHTGMTCVRGRCDCPPYSALNLTSCACQQSALCPAPGTPAAEVGGYIKHTLFRLLQNPSSVFRMPPLLLGARSTTGGGARTRTAAASPRQTSPRCW